MVKQKFKNEFLTRTKVKNNILRIYYSGYSHDNYRHWYSDAFKWCTYVAIHNNISLNKVVGIVAALSPLKTWEQNKSLAFNFITHGKRGGHVRTLIEKAIAIIESDGTEEEILDILSGNKITSFYLNIRYPKAEGPVTIDRHALSVALGRFVTDADYKGMTSKQYAFFESCYRWTALGLGITPQELQSITWVTWRKIKNNYK